MMYNKYKFFPCLSLSRDVNFPTHKIIFAQKDEKKNVQKYAVNKQAAAENLKSLG